MTLLDAPCLTTPTIVDKASTLELAYLRPLLESLPEYLKSALDVGAHKGDFSDELAGLGFRVLAVEPQDYMADRFARRHADRIDAGQIILARCAASDHHGHADLIIGSASTVSTLEPSWTSVAFPEEFRSPRKVRVPVLPLADVAGEHEFGPIGFAKIDVEGHELRALSGLFGPRVAKPPIVMFEANQRFGEQAVECLALLHAQGYHTFDIFIRIGLDPIAGERFTGVGLPQCWRDRGDRYFYANIIGYHKSMPPAAEMPDPAAFVSNYQIELARGILRRAAEATALDWVPVHPIWQAACKKLRDYLLHENWTDFLRNPVCKEMFVRGRWSPTQDRELEDIKASEFGRGLLSQLRDPAVGGPRSSEGLPGISTNLLGMIWYLTRICRQAGGTLPNKVVELGGGYGALAFAYASTAPAAEYIIIDLPEMLAIQHYFLTLAMPDRPIVFADTPAATESRPGQITLVPIAQVNQLNLQAQLLISTFALSEMPRELQQRIENLRYFEAERLFITGQLSTQYPEIELVSHGQVVGAAMQQFALVQIERFHIGDHYLLLAQRQAAAA